MHLCQGKPHWRYLVPHSSGQPRGHICASQRPRQMVALSVEVARRAAAAVTGVRRHYHRHPVPARRSDSTTRLSHVLLALLRRDADGCRCAHCATYWDVVAAGYRRPCW